MSNIGVFIFKATVEQIDSHKILRAIPGYNLRFLLQLWFSKTDFLGGRQWQQIFSSLQISKTNHSDISKIWARAVLNCFWKQKNSSRFMLVIIIFDWPMLGFTKSMRTSVCLHSFSCKYPIFRRERYCSVVILVGWLFGVLLQATPTWILALLKLKHQNFVFK